jgi:hypothetical protein
VLYLATTTTLGLAGFVLLCKRRRDLALLFAGPLLLFPLPYYITHADFRFRLVLDPLATLLCAYAVTHWTRPKQAAAFSESSDSAQPGDAQSKTIRTVSTDSMCSPAKAIAYLDAAPGDLPGR